MPLPYSCFISYRRNEHNKKYISNLKSILQSEAFNVTNRPRAFFDEDSIRYGEKLDPKIYSGIEDSYFFVLIWYMNYLHEDNLYCARELLHALSIEEKLQNLLPENERINFFFIIPFLVRGTISDLPECIANKLVVDITRFEYAIINNKRPAELITFIQKFYKDLSAYFKVYNSYITIDDYRQSCLSVERPDDDFVRNWVKQQRKEITKTESKNVPVLRKTDG